MKSRVILLIILITLLALTVYFIKFSDIKFSPKSNNNLKENIQPVILPLQNFMNCELLRKLSESTFQQGIDYICNKECTNRKNIFKSATCSGKNVICSCS